MEWGEEGRVVFVMRSVSSREVTIMHQKRLVSASTIGLGCISMEGEGGR